MSYRVDTCSACKFWDCNAYERGRHGASSLHELQEDCRRHAPIDMSQEELTKGLRLWPQTRGDDWCGDFELSRDVGRS